MRKFLWLILLLATPALATDYYVRTDGSDSNTGLGNTAGTAWASPSKCAASPVTAGNRCRIQPGTYYIASPVTQAAGGTLVLNDAMTDCKCTAGSATITCGTTVTGVSAGQFVRCDATGPYFNWTRVASVAGNIINLDEGYRGVSSAGNTFLDIANFVEIVGDGSVGSIILTRTQVQPGGVTWTQSGTYPEVWSYLKSTGTGTWTAPKGFRQTSASWDKWFANRSGEDTWIKVSVSACPCSNAANCEAHVENVEGSWCDDGTRIWARAFGNVNPNTNGVVASGAGLFTTAWTNLQPYTVLRNIVFDIAGESNGYNTDTTNAILFGASNALLQSVTTKGGLMRMDLTSARTMMELNGVRALDKINAASANVTHSGLRFYDVEMRGGYSNTLLVDYLKGTSPSDRVMFDRVYLHRTFTWYRTQECTADPVYDCATEAFVGDKAQAGAHGADLGNPSVNQFLDHIMFQNSIVEVTGDGWGVFNAGSDVVVRNCTFGVSHSVSANTRQETIRWGISGVNSGLTVYNTIFYADALSGPVYNGAIWNYSPNWTGYVGDYNLFLNPYNSGNVATSTETFKGVGGLPDYSHQTMITSLGQELHSLTVCNSGCSATNATVFNDGTASRNYFTKPTVSDGTISDYTPIKDVSRAINAGLLIQCPSYDFYGNPRSDGQCDIGAVELQGGVEPAGPHRTDIRPGTKLR
jgi:hypothetical protein